MNPYYRMNAFGKWMIDNNLKFLLYPIFVILLPVAILVYLFENIWLEIPSLWNDIKFEFSDLNKATKPAKENN